MDFRRRKLKEESSANKGLEFNGPYGYTNDVILPKSPDRLPPRLPQTLGKQETPNDDIYHDIKEDEQQYTYIDLNSNTVLDDKQKHDAEEGLIVIYAKSEYGGRAQDHESHYPSDATDYAYACPSEITEQPIDNDYIYATSDSVSMPQQANETYETEGLKDNEIYATDNNVEVRDNQEGWEENLIYVDTDKGPEVKGQNIENEGWEDNVVYAANEK